MKSNLKIKSLTTSLLLITGFFIFFPTFVFAAEASWTMPDPKIDIPGITEFTQPKCEKNTNGDILCSINWLSEYIAGIYKYAIGAVAILATIVMMIGGIVWITAGGSQTRISTAKDYISGAIVGLVLVFSSYTILYYVNPDLVKLKAITVTKIEKKEEAAPIIQEYCHWAASGECESGTFKHYKYSDCGTKPEGDAVCCCPSDAKICEEKGLSFPTDCGVCNSCGYLTVPFKDGNKVKESLALSLKTAYDNKTINWWVTEAWPPEVGHQSACHANGGCVDINLTNRSTDVTDVKKVYDNLKAAGLNPTYEHRTDCALYIAQGISCLTNNVEPHFHVNP